MFEFVKSPLSLISAPIRGLLVCTLIALASLLPISGSMAAELVMLEEDGCPWCEQWREEVGGIYPVTEEGKIAPLRVVDIHEKLPEDLSFLTKGGYTPTFILINKGREIGRIRGYPGESFFWGLLSLMIEKLPKADKSST